MSFGPKRFICQSAGNLIRAGGILLSRRDVASAENSMEPGSFVVSAVFLLLVTSVTVALSKRLGLGSVIVLLVAGVIIGPHS
jgi:hypothetical protein